MQPQQEIDPAAFGQSIGRRLAAEKASAANPATALRIVIDAVLAEYPAAKLPMLSADGEMKRWLTAYQLGDGQLRAALTEARRVLRKGVSDSSVKRPPKPRRKRLVAAAPTRSSTPPLPGIVPNRPLHDL